MARMQMTASERFRAVLDRKSVDRLPVIEWAPWWHLTRERWLSEGIACADGDVLTLQRYFGLDGCVQSYMGARTRETPKPPYHGAGLLRDEAGYEAILPTLYPDPETLMTDETFARLQAIRDAGDTLLFFTVDGFFWYPRALFGIEPHLYSFYDEPELLTRMCDDYLRWLKRVFEYVGNKFTFDFMTFQEDMSYNLGPMIGKDAFDEFLALYYNAIIPQIKACGMPVIVDSDGDITKAVDWYAEVRADGMLPLERQAGVDVALYIEKQPDMTFIGHFDKMCMKFGEDAMRAEFERLLSSMRTSRLIPSVDHQT
nr:hypothetical protein [Clostridia bacterium]